MLQPPIFIRTSKRLSFACFVLLLAFSRASKAEPVLGAKPPSGTLWRTRCLQVRRGMKRSAVEKILPVYTTLNYTPTIPDGYYYVYAVDSEWVVKVPYDAHNCVADAKKYPYLLENSYETSYKVVGIVFLKHQHTD